MPTSHIEVWEEMENSVKYNASSLICNKLYRNREKVYSQI